MYRLDRQGLGICFEDVGKGAPPLVFIHESGCDHSSFARQLEHFSRTHRVVALDLRGHGASEGAPGDASVPCLADDVAWLCYELGIYAPVIVGHGLGGMVALELAARYPDLPAAVVMLNSPLLPPPDATASYIEGNTAWNSAAAAAACRVPIHYVDAGTCATDVDWLAKLCPRLTQDRIEGACHFAHVELPEQVNGILERFIRSLSGYAAKQEDS